MISRVSRMPGSGKDSGIVSRTPEGFFKIPGFCDVHVHFREPGFSYKETMVTGSQAAVRGGYTAVCTMPNLNPVPDSPEHLAEEEKLIKAAGDLTDIYPYGALTAGQKGQKSKANESKICQIEWQY